MRDLNCQSLQLTCDRVTITLYCMGLIIRCMRMRANVGSHMSSLPTRLLIADFDSSPQVAARAIVRRIDAEFRLVM